MFDGRLSRKNFALGFLTIIITFAMGSVLLLWIAGALGGQSSNAQFIWNGGFLALVLLVFVVELSLFIRRWHDLGRSGWWSLLNLIPLLNLFVLIYLFFTKSNDISNPYGASNIDQPFWRSLFKSDPNTTLVAHAPTNWPLIGVAAALLVGLLFAMFQNHVL